MELDHHTFTLARTYPHTPAQVFAAWSDPAKKALWFGNAPTITVIESTVDFRVGGRDHAASRHDSGFTTTYDAEYVSIVEDELIIYMYGMTVDGTPLSGSVATIVFEPVEGGTLLTLTEQGVYLGSFAEAGGAGRAEGTAILLESLGTALDSLYSSLAGSGT
jgi:uncharacterized protein YndB with AHSA1/START domain